MSKSRYHIAIIDPSEIFRRGLAHIIDEMNQFQIEIVASELPSLGDESIDIVVINPMVAQSSAVKQIFANAKLVAILYNYIDQNVLRQFDDSIELNDSAEKIIQTLYRGVDNKTTRSILGDVEELSEREQEILIAVAKGMINKEIADHFNISIHTVIAHRKNISRKTAIRSVSGLVVYALLNNLITESDILM